MNEGASKDSAACVSDARTTHTSRTMQLKPEDNAWTSAYRYAWSARPEEEKRVLSGKPLDSLFEQLNQKTDQNYNDSKLHQSTEKILPLLEKMHHLLGVISPVAGFANASASIALEVVQTFSTVCLHSPISPPILGVLTPSVCYQPCPSRS